MAYDYIPVANAIDVAKQIATYAAANGWTIHRNAARTTPAGWWYVIMSYRPGGPYFTVMADNDSMHMNLARGINTNADWNVQPDQAFVTSTGYARISFRVMPLVGIHLFAGSTPTPYLFVAIENQPGYYRHIVFGELDTFGAVGGGSFVDVGTVDNTYPSAHNHLRIPLTVNITNTASGWKGSVDIHLNATDRTWGHFRDDVITGGYSAGAAGTEVFNVLWTSPSTFNSRAILTPPLVYLYNLGGEHRPLGTHHAIRYINLRYYNAGDELTIGSDVWKVFPVTRKGGVNSSNSIYNAVEFEGSGEYGIAYLKAE